MVEKKKDIKLIKKAMVATQSDDDSSESEDEREETSNLCLIAQTNANSRISDSESESDDEGVDKEEVMAHLLTFFQAKNLSIMDVKQKFWKRTLMNYKWICAE